MAPCPHRRSVSNSECVGCRCPGRATAPTGSPSRCYGRTTFWEPPMQRCAVGHLTAARQVCALRNGNPIVRDAQAGKTTSRNYITSTSQPLHVVIEGGQLQTHLHARCHGNTTLPHAGTMQLLMELHEMCRSSSKWMTVRPHPQLQVHRLDDSCNGKPKSTRGPGALMR